ncbi:DMT family transporter [Sciscionella marina]|uniref:DMT family transporter n=1 Tax=Sciscionella marina TaxID=508770 RepID=UPI0003A2A6AF|nr:DMT family transporter [Sciscionella marina]
MQWIAVGAGLGAAVGFAVNTSFQHHGVTGTHTDATARWWVRVATRPVWLAGSAAGLVAVALQAFALAMGPVTIVQPILTTELVFALSANGFLQRRRPERAEVVWAGILLAGLTAFLLAASPQSGSPGQINRTTLLLSALTTLGLAAVLAVLANGTLSRYRAALLGASTGLGFGIVSVLGKYCLLQIRDGPLPVLMDWPVWMLLAMALASVIVEQAAFRAGPLAASLPPLTVLDPLVATCGGVVALNETMRVSGTALVFEGISGACLVFAAIGLARHTAIDR